MSSDDEMSTARHNAMNEIQQYRINTQRTFINKFYFENNCADGTCDNAIDVVFKQNHSPSPLIDFLNRESLWTVLSKVN